MSSIALRHVVMCENCTFISDSVFIRGEVCPVCACQGSLLSLARVLNPSGTQGEITFICATSDRNEKVMGQESP